MNIDYQKFFKNTLDPNIKKGQEITINGKNTGYHVFSFKAKTWEESFKRSDIQDIKTLEHYEKRGKSRKGTDNYQLDHIIPISEGFRNNIDANIIGDITNLRFIPWLENILRNKQNKLI
jgi:hypothetical protein